MKKPKPSTVKNGIGIGFALAGGIYAFNMIANYEIFAVELARMTVSERMELFSILMTGSFGLVVLYIYSKIGKAVGTIWSYVYEKHYYESEKEVN